MNAKTNSKTDAVIEAEVVEATRQEVDVVVTKSDAHAVIEAMNNTDSAIVSTFTADDWDTRKQIVRAMSDDTKLADHTGEVIDLVNWVSHIVTVTDDDGVVSDVVRTVLIDKDGKSFASVSDGIASALTRIKGVLGHPSTWPEPAQVKAVSKQSSNNAAFRYLTLQLM